MKADGKAGTFLHTFLEHRERLEALVFRRTGCRATASDLVQDLFLRLWRRPIDDPGNVVGYLFRSARNLAIDHLRAESMRQGLDTRSVPQQHGAEPPAPDAVVHARRDLASVEDTLRALPERVRHVFLLNRVHGRTYADIARALNVSVSTVEKDMMRALAACKACLEDGHDR
jgi:RNA polymerase sigma factor, sigma-70 family